VPTASVASREPAVTATPADNPLFTESSLPFHAPPFDKLRSAHFVPAFEEAMKQELAEVERIANNPEEPTFENTMVALERSGRMLTRVANAFSVLTSANTNPDLQRIDESAHLQGAP
jgi:peptidyl-dipeptidase Dcp